jgi:hypothetical protein
VLRFYDDEGMNFAVLLGLGFCYHGITKQLVRFTEAEGADWHCEPAAQGLRDERVFDWLEETLGISA